MDHLHSTTTEHRKGQHLSFEHRVLIQTRLKDGWSPNGIAKEIGCAPNTVRNEIKRGTVALYRGNVLFSISSVLPSRITSFPIRIPERPPAVDEICYRLPLRADE